MHRAPCVYIMASDRNGTLYTGVTSILPQRIHKTARASGRDSRAAIGASCRCSRPINAWMKRSRAKSSSRVARAKKMALIEAMNPQWRDLCPGARALPFAVPWRRTLPPPPDCFVARAPRNDGAEVGPLVSWRCQRLSLRLFRQPAPAFEHSLARRALLGKGQRLRGGIDLVVVAGVWKQHEFGEIIWKPRGASGRWTKPFSVVAVCAKRRMTLSPS